MEKSVTMPSNKPLKRVNAKPFDGRMTMRLPLVALLFSSCCWFLPCDPGWGYAPVDSASTDVVGATVLASASLFAGRLTASIEISNEADSVLVVRPNQLVLVDSRDVQAARVFPERPFRCAEKPGIDEVRLRKGDICKIRSEFSVRPDPVVLERVRIVHTGLSRDGGSIPVVLLLRKDT